MKKMALVPASMVRQLMEAESKQKQLVSDTALPHLISLEEHLREILESKEPDDVKLKLYQQILQTYAKVRDNEINPAVFQQSQPEHAQHELTFAPNIMSTPIRGQQDIADSIVDMDHEPERGQKRRILANEGGKRKKQREDASMADTVMEHEAVRAKRKQTEANQGIKRRKARKVTAKMPNLKVRKDKIPSPKQRELKRRALIGRRRGINSWGDSINMSKTLNKAQWIS